MNRRSFLGLSAGGLITLVGCGNEEGGQSDLQATMSSLENENSALQTEVANLQPTVMPTPLGTPSSIYSGAVADRQSFEHDGWVIQSTGYAPLGYLMNPDSSSSYFEPRRDKIVLFAFLVTNISEVIRTFPREAWSMLDDLGDVHQPRMFSFERGPAAEALRIAPGGSEEFWVCFDVERARVSVQLLYQDGIAIFSAPEEFPTTADSLPVSTNVELETRPRRDVGSSVYKDPAEDSATPVSGGTILWNDWQIESVESVSERILELKITNVSDSPKVFMQDRLAIIDTYDRWYQVSSLFRPSTNTYSYGDEIDGVELDPHVPITVWISIITTVERQLVYLVAIDRSFAVDISES